MFNVHVDKHRLDRMLANLTKYRWTEEKAKYINDKLHNYSEFHIPVLYDNLRRSGGYYLKDNDLTLKAGHGFGLGHSNGPRDYPHGIPYTEYQHYGRGSGWGPGHHFWLNKGMKKMFKKKTLQKTISKDFINYARNS